MSLRTRPEMHLVLSDQHIPYQDPGVESLTLDFIKEHKPDVIHLLGDILDFYTLSRFDKDPARAHQLQDDLDQGCDYLSRIRRYTKAPIIWSEGNHENRLRRYLWGTAPEIAGLRSLRFEELMRLKEFDIKWAQAMKPYRVGKLLFTHGELVRKWSGMTARGHYEKYGCSVIHGHCFDDQTEILTPDGWVTHDKLTEQSIVMTLDRDADVLAWNKVEAVYRYDDIKELVTIKSRDVDLEVTGGHGLWTGSRAREYAGTYAGKSLIRHRARWRETTADEQFGNKRTIFRLAATHNEGPGIPESDDFIRLLAWIMTEGELFSYRGGRIAQSDAPDGRLARVAACLDSLGISYSKILRYHAGETEHGTHRNFDAYRFNLHAGLWYDDVLKYIDGDKNPLRSLAGMSLRQMQVFLDTFIDGDGCKNSDALNSYQIGTNTKSHLDFLQEVAVRTGHRSSVSGPGADGLWHLTINMRQTTTVPEKAWGRRTYDGTSWCVSVPNGTLVVRRGGHTAITLNTHRLGSFYHSTYEDAHGAWENGCLCSLAPEYMVSPDWQNGWSVVWFYQGYFHVEQVCVINGQYVYHGGMRKLSAAARKHKRRR